MYIYIFIFVRARVCSNSCEIKATVRPEADVDRRVVFYFVLCACVRLCV